MGSALRDDEAGAQASTALTNKSPHDHTQPTYLLFLNNICCRISLIAFPLVVESIHIVRKGDLSGPTYFPAALHCGFPPRQTTADPGGSEDAMALNQASENSVMAGPPSDKVAPDGTGKLGVFLVVHLAH